MTEYHVGCGIFGIYAGRLNKKGDQWLSKSDVTEEVLNSAFDYLYTNKMEIRAKVEGKEYVMRIVPYETEGSERNAT